MDKKQFKEFCKNEFMKKGFKKNKNTFSQIAIATRNNSQKSND